MTFIILDDGSGTPLSGSQAIMLLTESQSLGALMSAGLAVNDFVTSGKEIPLCNYTNI